MERNRKLVLVMLVAFLASCAATSGSGRSLLGDARSCVTTVSGVQSNGAESGNAVLRRCVNERSEVRPNLLGHVLSQVVSGLLFSDDKDNQDR